VFFFGVRIALEASNVGKSGIMSLASGRGYAPGALYEGFLSGCDEAGAAAVESSH
jgi:hypothetical protein